MVFAFNPAFGAWDAVSNKSLFTLGGAQAITPNGLTRTQTGTQKAWNAGPIGSGLQNITHWQRLRRTGTTASNTDAFGKNFQTNGSPSFVTWSVGYNGGGSGQNSIRANQGLVAGIAQTANHSFPDATVWHDVAVSKPDSQLKLYVNGVVVASTSAGAIAYGASGNNDVAANFSGATVPFDYGPGYLWNRALSDAEIKSLSDNPWQIFEPEVTRIWIDDTVSAGGAATVIPIGVQATGSVGTPSATGAATATPAGVSASSAVGTPIATGGASIPATVLPAGVQATGAIGAVSATGAAVAQPVGVVASGTVGTPVAIAGTSIPATVLPAGVQVVSAVGTPTAKGAAIAQPLGVAATAYVGSPTIATGVSGVAVVYPAGVQAIGQVGTLIATGAAWTAAVGVQAVASVGTPTAYAGEIVIYVAGAQTRPSRLQSSSRPSRLQTGTRASR